MSLDEVYERINPEIPIKIKLENTPGFLAFINNIENSINQGNPANIIKGDGKNLDTKPVQPDDSSYGINVPAKVALVKYAPNFFANSEGKVKLKENSIDKLLYVYCVLFRIMIYYDQSHDIAQKEDRNKLYREGIDTDNDNRTKIILDYLFNILIDDIYNCILKDKPGIFNGRRADRDGSEILIKDFEKNTYKTLNNFLEEIKSTNINEDKRQAASTKLIDFFFNIQANNIGNTLRSKDIPYDCNHNYKTLLSIVNYTKNTLIKDIYPDIVREDGNKIDNTKNKIIATVDADKSKFNVASITSVICALNVVNMSQDDDRLTFLSDPASEFDSAGKSSVETLVTRLLGKKGKFSTLSNFKVMLNKTCILEFRYVEENKFITPTEDPCFTKNIQNIQNLYSIIIGTARSSLNDAQKIILNNPERKIAKNLLREVGIIKQIMYSDEKYDYKTKFIMFFENLKTKEGGLEIIKKLSIQTDVKKLIVTKFFNLEPKAGEKPFTRDEKESSVNSITTDIVDKLTDGGMFVLKNTLDTKDYNWLREFNKLIIFKELGDLGQILSTYCLQLHKRISPNQSRIDQTIYFITFDKLAGKMSSLFNYGTIFEQNGDDSNYNASFPLQVFVYEDLADYQDILYPAKILLSLRGKSIKDSKADYSISEELSEKSPSNSRRDRSTSQDSRSRSPKRDGGVVKKKKTKKKRRQKNNKKKTKKKSNKKKTKKKSNKKKQKRKII